MGGGGTAGMRLTFFEQVRGGEVGVLASTSRSAKGVRWKCIPRVRVEATRHQRAARDAREEARGSNEYNWLRLQLVDGHDSNKKRAIHWTGPKGKKEIMRQMEKTNG